MTDLLTLGRSDLILVARHTTADKFDADQLTLHAVGLQGLHLLAVDELLALGKLRDPTQTCLQGRGRIVDIVAIEAEALLQAQRIAGTQADVLQAELLAGLPKRLPELIAVLVGHIDLATTRARVARDRENGIHTGHLHLAEGVVLHLLHRLGA